MERRFLIFLSFILLLILGCSHTNLPAKDNLNTSPSLTIQSIPTNKIDNIEKEDLSGIRQEVNTFFEIAKQQLSEAMQQVTKAEKRGDFYLNVVMIIGVIFTTIGVIFAAMGSRGLIDLRKLQKEFTETVELHRFLQQRAIEKQQELHLQHGYLVLDHPSRKKFTDLEKEKFLDFDHMIYFIYHNLPLTKDPDFYKMSLYILGTFFLWDNRPERAIIRFEEAVKIENIHTIHKPSDKFEHHIHAFYNLYGIACLHNAKKYKNEIPSESEIYINRAIEYFNKSILIKQNFSKPYYNLGLVYSLWKKNDETGISYYKQVIGKNPRVNQDGEDMYLRTYMNWACCWIRYAKLTNPDEELINILDNIPYEHSLWKEIINDKLLVPVLSTEKGRAFLQKKCPSIIKNF